MLTELTTASGPDVAARPSQVRDTLHQLLRRPRFVVAGSFVTLMIVVSAVPQVFAGWFGHGDPRACDLSNSVAGPRAGHPFGFDKQGCDVYANVIHGARASISIGLLVTVTSLAIAVVLGCLSAYYLGWLDTLVSRLSDVFFGFPFILGALVVLTSFQTRSVWSVSAALALFGWPGLTRLMRASALSAKQMDYVLAARSIGASDLRIIRRHVIPNAIAPVLVISAIAVGTVIAAEATLTFIGIGLQQPAISWGLQLAVAQTDFQTHPHLLVFPGLFLSATVLSFVVLGDVLQDVLDPRRRDD